MTPRRRIADAGVDLILVGDSVANNVLGYETPAGDGADMVQQPPCRAKPRP